MQLIKIYQRTPGLLEHSLRVLYFCQQVIEYMPESLLTRQQERDMLAAAMYHDVGKSTWHTSWFTAPRHAIRNVDWTVMQAHPIQAINILNNVSIYVTPGAKKIIEQHHERPGGTGYPYSIEPDFVSVIFAAVDVFCACTEPRKYREAPLSIGKALKEVKRFAPEIVIAALQHAVKKIAA